jgi:hypothetical protein
LLAVLGFERRVVGALTGDVASPDRARIEAWVEVSLDDLPDVVRLGVRAQSIVLGLWYRTRPDEVLVARLQESPLWPVRGYLRAIRSLVLMARHELEALPA